jgi:hypothetical protein
MLDRAAYAALAKPSVPLAPSAYKSVEPELFTWIVNQTTLPAPGGGGGSGGQDRPPEPKKGI